MNNTAAEIHMDVLESNVRTALAALQPPTELMFVVKANAYGHGMAPVAARAHAAGVQWFTVAHVYEALELRRAVPHARILVIGVATPEDVPAMAAHRILCVVVSEEHGRRLHDAALKEGKRLPVHLKVDTGMGRLGVLWDQAAAVHSRLCDLPGLDVQGVCTHFASVEPRKAALAPDQVSRFREVTNEMERHAGRRLFKHVSSSRAFQYYRDWDLDAVRPGIILYGYGSSERDMRVPTRPILQWKTKVTQAKRVPAGFAVGYYSTHTTPAPTVIATLGVGYADGYHRALSNKGAVLIRGRRCAVVGRISMNWTTVDCGADSDIQAGDEAVLIGTQGSHAIWADELARAARTIPYEILTSIHPHVPRRYMG